MKKSEIIQQLRKKLIWTQAYVVIMWILFIWMATIAASYCENESLQKQNAKSLEQLNNRLKQIHNSNQQ